MSGEVPLTGRIRLMVKREFPEVYIQRVSDKFLAGLPDLRLIAYGFSGDLEVKTTHKRSKTSKIQDKVLEWIDQAGGARGVVRSVEEARLWVRKFSTESRMKAEVLESIMGRTYGHESR